MKMSLIKYFPFCLLLACLQLSASAQSIPNSELENNFLNPPASAKPWVFWYWMHGAVSKEGITADLEAMKAVGIGGAYLMPIQDTVSAIPFQPTVRQLTPEWWDMVKFSMQEAKRVGLQLAMHVSDGFALAGGPWITPELSMQKLVWTKTYVKSSSSNIKLVQPETNGNYYKDVAVYAYPARSSNAFSNTLVIPQVTSSSGEKPQFLAAPDKSNKQSFRSDSTCWIQYQYPEPFTCQSVCIHAGGNNYQAQRLIIQASDDGEHFKTIIRLQPPRHGWQDTDEDYTYAIPATKAKYFRFVYDKKGTEPGSEDLDAAKWKPTFKVMGIYLNDEPVINNYEGKNGSVWRVAMNTTTQQVSDSDAVGLNSIINLTDKLDGDGNLNWSAPAGWVIVRIGHTSTGHTNATGGAGIGLECDKFNAEAIQLQFNNWFAQAFERTDAILAKEVLKVFHVDSWECGSQNWSRNFKDEFQKRRGYDLMPYLLVMTGVPVQNAATSEKVLHDVRQTIAELVNDIFYTTLNKLAHEKGCSFSAESVAPTMVSDGLLHYKNEDVPMGEFWLNSPTHDKPNDMLDAISGAHIYGKNIIQAEAFTSVRMNWGEHPGNLKTVGDRNFALGINKLVLHVFTHNPWMNKKPGMTLDGVGLYFQRDQTWFKQSKAWIAYLSRCQALLQTGKPVVDVAVFTSEEVPRRSILPDRLVNTLPGIFDKEKLAEEKKRLTNTGQPLRNKPDGVNHSANMADPEDWIDPLNGYAYDSFNPDVLLHGATVKDRRVVLPGGSSYALLVFPDQHPMHPNDSLMSVAIAKKLVQLVNNGATIIMGKQYFYGTGLKDNDDSVRLMMKQLHHTKNKKGKLIFTPYVDFSFVKLGVQKDVEIINDNHSIAWVHRKTANADVYFISNQIGNEQVIKMSFPVTGKVPEIWNAVDKTMTNPLDWKTTNNRINVTQRFSSNQSLFIVFRNNVAVKKSNASVAEKSSVTSFINKWKVQFDTNFGGLKEPVIFNELKSWSQNSDSSIKYYSGTAIYTNTFSINNQGQIKATWLRFDSICNIATLKINGTDCGTLWTPPFTLNITKAIKQGVNRIEIEVSNTWHNRLIGDNLLPVEKRVTYTTAPFRLKDKPLLPAGIIGNIELVYK